MKKYRRFLLDMHIPDWDEAFLSSYEPADSVAAWAGSGVESTMLYCLSHAGLAYWPTKVGIAHAAMKGRDFVGEALKACRKHGIEAFAYYSAIFNNRAWLEHPDWRIVPSALPAPGSFMGARYGHVCPNNPDYRAFVLAQIDELMEGYRFDGFFFDMTFWPAICLCPSCRERLRSEEGIDIPETVDWFSPEWCAFQASRERWMNEFSLLLSAEVKKYAADIPVCHNAAILLLNWTRGQNFDHAKASDFLAGDFYGDATEQLMTSRLMRGLSRTLPIEFMTSRTLHLKDHVQSKSVARIAMQAVSALTSGAAIRIIDAIDPAGTVQPEFYRQLGELFASLAPLEPFVGGEAVEDIAVYASDASRMNYGENGHSIAESGLRAGSMPHVDALRGAVRALARAHLPFGIVTREALSRLGKFRLLILPDLLRMDEEEMQAVRAYVLAGGRLYASRFTSLATTGGQCLDDFGLADLFGCRPERGAFLPAPSLPDAARPKREVPGLEAPVRGLSLPGSLAYFEVKDPGLRELLSPQPMLSHPLSGDEAPGMVLLRAMEAPALGHEPSEGADAAGATRVLATLTLPYGWPEEGSAADRRWASIHSSPPWTDTGLPVVVEHDAGAGKVIYSAADIESVDHWAHERFFLGLVRRLLGGEASFGTDAHPCVWMNVFHQPERCRYVISFLNRQVDEPLIPLGAFGFRLRLPARFRALSLVSVPDGLELPFATSESGTLSAGLDRLDLYRILVLDYRIDGDPTESH
jgi:hypothetical protein